MKRVEILPKNSQKFMPDFSCRQRDFSEFKEQIWIPLLKDKMRSWKLYTRIYTRYLEKFLNAYSPILLTGEELQIFARRLERKKLTSGTYNRILSVLKHFLKTSYEYGIIDKDFTSLVAAYFVKAESKRETCLDADKINLLFKKLTSSDSRQAKAIELLILTGASKSEILTARWEDYDSLGHLLTVKSRNGSKRTLRLGPQSVAVLEALSQTVESSWIFPAHDKTKHINDIFLFWDEVRRECGLNNIRIQDLKHNYKNWQKNNAGYSVFIEEQLEPEVKRQPSLTPYIGLMINPEIALIGISYAKYEIGCEKTEISYDVSTNTENALLINYLGHIFKAGMEALNVHNRKKFFHNQEKFYIDLAKSALKNAKLSKNEWSTVRSAVYLGLENQAEYPINSYRPDLLHDLNGIHNNLAQYLTSALNFSYKGIEINSPGCSFLTALQTASYKIACGDLDIALVGGTGAFNSSFIKEKFPDFTKECYSKMLVLCSPVYAEKAKITVLSYLALSALNTANIASRKETLLAESL